MGAHGKMAALGAILALLGSVLDAQKANQGKRELDGDIHPPPQDKPDADFIIIKGVRHRTHQHDSQGDIHRGDMEMKVQEEESEMLKLQNYIARMKKDPSLPPPDPQEFPSIRFHGTSIAALEKSVKEAKEDLSGPNINADGAQKPEVQSLLDVLNGEAGVVARRAEHNDMDDEEEGRERQRRLMEKSPSMRWTNGIVPYVFTVNDSNTVRGIKVAMHKIEYYSCIRFVPYEAGVTRQKYGLDHDGYLKFIVAGGCYATQGNVRSSTGQNVACCGWETCVHELGHALGLAHEHMNEFRDDFVNVNFDGASDSYKMWYTKSLRGQYDYAELFDITNTMSYGSGTFAKPGMTTMSLLDENSRFGSGHFYYFKNIVEGHNCKAMNCSSFTQTCANDGFVSLVNSQCACLCPAGLDPATGCTSAITEEANSATSWPGGKWGLLQPKDGCPGGEGDFQTGTVVQHSEPGNWVRGYYHLAGVSYSKLSLPFCMRDSNANQAWPPGRYCIYRYGGACPEGFGTAYAQFDDTIPAGESNSQTGAYPDGVYGNNTRYEFCCRSDSFDDIPLMVPNTKNFILYRMDYWQSCPNVPGMVGETEFYSYNSADIEGLNPGFYGDIKPLGLTWGGHFYYIYYCYFQPKYTNCGGYYELSDSNTEVVFSSPNYPNEYPSRSQCNYFVKGPVNSTLVLTFEDFTLDTYCKDTLAVRFNNPGEVATSFCGGGGKLEGSFHSVRNFLSLTFTSDSLVNAKGFKARVRMVPDSELCYSKKDKGASYRGTKNYTRTFKPCVPWSEVSHCRTSLFGSSDDDYDLDGNYCRNPGFGIMPWCYTVAETCERAYCDVCNLDRPRDTLDDCAALQSSGQCAQNPRLALSGCALTCNAQLPTETTPPTVSTVSCGAPPSVPFASILESPKASYAVGDKVTYKCQDGYETVSSSCLTTGAWSPVNYVCGGCSDGWFYSDGFCYGFDYDILNTPEAMKRCATYNGGILTPLKNAKELAVVERLRDLREEFRTILIGLNDTKTEGVFYWTDGTPASNVNWAPSQPDNYYNEDCGALKGDSTVNDVYCSSRSAFVCRTALRVPGTALNTSTLICADRRADCSALFERHPGFCEDHEGFAVMNCRLTCGFCGEGSVCSAPSIPAGSGLQMLTDAATVSTGDTFRMDCPQGTVLTAGNLVRGCRPDGTLTGSQPVCSAISSVPTQVNSLELFARGSNGEASYTYLGSSPSLTIARTGALTRWTFHSTLARKMALQVWRPSTTQTGMYTLVGYTNVTTKADRINVIDLTPATAIPVQPTDIIGLWFGAGSEGGVTFNTCDAGERPEGTPVYKVKVEEAALYTTTSVTLPATSQCLVFSLTATISP